MVVESNLIARKQKFTTFKRQNRRIYNSSIDQGAVHGKNSSLHSSDKSLEVETFSAILTYFQC